MLHKGRACGKSGAGAGWAVMWEMFWESDAAESSGPGLLEHPRLFTRGTPRILSSPLVSQLKCFTSTLGLLLRQDGKER